MYICTNRTKWKLKGILNVVYANVGEQAGNTDQVKLAISPPPPYPTILFASNALTSGLVKKFGRWRRILIKVLRNEISCRASGVWEVQKAAYDNIIILIYTSLANVTFNNRPFSSLSTKTFWFQKNWYTFQLLFLLFIFLSND